MVIVKLEGIPGQFPGNRCEPDLTGGIEVSSVSWGSSVELSGSGGSFAASTVRFDRITFTKALDKATGPLMTNCATGRFVKSAKIYWVRSGAAAGMYVVQKIELTDNVVSAYTLNGTTGGEDPVESITFSPAQVQLTYYELKANGQMGPATKAGWDMKTNKAI
jgi:type VI protein secretion system component Hcp